MTVSEFFELFLDELRQSPELTSYYKFLADPGSFEFRKAYVVQRLHYILDHLPNKEAAIWDCGCGYGTTAIFLALNGYKVHGTTLEFYYEHIAKRMAYWSQFGDVVGFTYSYENLFDSPPPPASYDHVIIQDTLHHLEPLQDALRIFRESLRPGGTLILVEENGGNVVQTFKLYLRRGNKRIITIYDEQLKKDILLGNENIRNLATWRRELAQQQLYIPDAEVQYIRLFPPFFFKPGQTPQVLARENKLWRTNSFLKENFFFGLNFIVEKEPRK
ncbi:class I SAM-dependent methyltransferase [Hymenobacter sp. ASUV-10]|uniref:Class I SAM-dependent methyltransferase n=1 Tax=Hymenobacter aranciens TaxID=3063996 RepID=A0ABT9B821_9BACT|nr:class I SAM-dependent methyltransferase [Hymenobacter sp. ASUV-10]MDO7873803.1 class I SAM-dependent methyltransferase [Hymenobacter sp. ASUV-10]